MDLILQDSAERIKKLLTDLSQFTSASSGGVTRLPFSPAAKQATLYIKEEMGKIGLKTQIDLVGNVHGILEAGDGDAKTLIMGSHYDTVKNGGRFDGIAGVVCALEVARLLVENSIKLKHSFEVIAFNDEEGMMFGSGCLGSKYIMGEVDHHYITHLTDENDISIRQWMINWGSNPDEITKKVFDIDKILAFLEIHIEQGPVLDKEDIELGIVNCIVGLLRCMITVRGRTDHAGTTPMAMRRDAMDISAKVISRLGEFAAVQNNGAVATSGFIRAVPNAMNVIAGQVDFTVDMRSCQNESIEDMYRRMCDLLNELTSDVGANYEIDVKLRTKPVNMADPLVKALEKICTANGFHSKTMLSGAAHDAMIFAADGIDTSMIFVPSVDGRSHCPEENSKYDDFAKAVKAAFDLVCGINTGDCLKPKKVNEE